MKLNSNNHLVFSLHYYLVICIKYRRKVINNSISYRLKEVSKLLNSYKST